MTEAVAVIGTTRQRIVEGHLPSSLIRGVLYFNLWFSLNVEKFVFTVSLKVCLC